MIVEILWKLNTKRRYWNWWLIVKLGVERHIRNLLTYEERIINDQIIVAHRFHQPEWKDAWKFKLVKQIWRNVQHVYIWNDELSLKVQLPERVNDGSDIDELCTMYHKLSSQGRSCFSKRWSRVKAMVLPLGLHGPQPCEQRIRIRINILGAVSYSRVTWISRMSNITNVTPDIKVYGIMVSYKIQQDNHHSSYIKKFTESCHFYIPYEIGHSITS